MEVWKKSPLIYDFIEVSNLGRARTLDRITTGVRENGSLNTQLKRGRLLSPWVNHNGYLTIAVKNGPTRRKFLLHRLIGSAFCDDFDPALSVNHKNGNKLDNSPVNLEWVTLARNSEHQWETGLIDIRGEKHPLHKLKNSDVATILKLLQQGERVIKIAERFNVSDALIYKIRSGRKPLIET